ncbi:hypothetical protein LOD99_7849 [Oopsacas minuta]|uniref:ISXO2-like transposase domain-containing protein n=1 Tax=Oopsacas minuta TaxID=111878 RepID=A0AAV7JQ40_9METZ|nr:hypothetical protein LOD99_7849 [Oopsacas minuta]
MGGPEEIVEIDESMFGRRKYHRGIQLSDQGNFGGGLRNQRHFRGFSWRLFSYNSDSNKNTYILPGTTIISNQWASYNLIRGTLPYLTVNHSENLLTRLQVYIHRQLKVHGDIFKGEQEITPLLIQGKRTIRRFL